MFKKYFLSKIVPKMNFTEVKGNIINRSEVLSTDVDKILTLYYKISSSIIKINSKELIGSVSMVTDCCGAV